MGVGEAWVTVCSSVWAAWLRLLRGGCVAAAGLHCCSVTASWACAVCSCAGAALRLCSSCAGAEQGLRESCVGEAGGSA